MLPFIGTEIYPQGPPKAEWPSITDRWDARIMGTWNVRCRVVALLQLTRYWEAAQVCTRARTHAHEHVQVHVRICARVLQLTRYWEAAQIYTKTMDWVRSRRPAIDQLA